MTARVSILQVPLGSKLTQLVCKTVSGHLTPLSRVSRVVVCVVTILLIHKTDGNSISMTIPAELKPGEYVSDSYCGIFYT